MSCVWRAVGRSRCRAAGWGRGREFESSKMESVRERSAQTLHEHDPCGRSARTIRGRSARGSAWTIRSDTLRKAVCVDGLGEWFARAVDSGGQREMSAGLVRVNVLHGWPAILVTFAEALLPARCQEDH